VSPALTTAAVLYLGIVALVAVGALLGLPLRPAARTGQVTGYLLTLVVVGADVVSLVTGQRPADLPTHLAYAATAVALPLLAMRLSGQDEGADDRVDLVLVAASSIVGAVVLARLAQTWG